MEGTPDAARRRRPLEGAAVLLAVAGALTVLARVTATPRAALLFTDSDSMLPSLVMRSLEVGQVQDWAMSSVLFLPELALFGCLWLVSGSPQVTAALAALVNLLLLYAAFRWAAGSHARARAPVVGALLAFGAFGVLALADDTASRDSLELASLLTTTTYYSGTVLATVATVGLARQLVEAGGRRWVRLLVLGLLAGVSVLSNPLYLLWATGPVGVLLLVDLVWHRNLDAALGAGVLAAASGLGYAARGLFSSVIANDGLGYIEWGRALESAAYYGGLVAERWGTAGGRVSVVVVAALWLGAVAVSIRLARAATRGAFLVACAAWVLPLLVTASMILLGTQAGRYLQPVVFAPPLALTVLPEIVRLPEPRVSWRALVAGTVAVALGLLAGGVIPQISTAVSRPDADLDCVTAWVDASGRTGAGQFWTIRLPKAHVADTRTLVQVDHTLRPYHWLVNRADSTVGAVSFLISDSMTYPFALPDGRSMDEAGTVACGRYTIAFFDEPIRLGTPRS